jgi:hypothetical protein
MKKAKLMGKDGAFVFEIERIRKTASQLSKAGKHLLFGHG